MERAADRNISVALKTSHAMHGTFTSSSNPPAMLLAYQQLRYQPLQPEGATPMRHSTTRAIGIRILFALAMAMALIAPTNTHRAAPRGLF
jgi:hypothetical protein